LLDRFGGRLAIDLGTGDGRFVLARAAAHSDWLHAGLDAHAASMATASARAARPASKGGLANALFIVGAVEAPPAELAGRAAELTVLLPWGSLLAAALGSPLLARVRALCREGARLEATLAFDTARDGATLSRLGIPPVSGSQQLAVWLRPRYAAAGFALRHVRPLARETVRALPSTWGRKLAVNAARRFFAVSALAFSSEVPRGADGP
jgi:hypothetical protein